MSPEPCANCGHKIDYHVWRSSRKSSVGECKFPKPGQHTFYRAAEKKITAPNSGTVA